MRTEMRSTTATGHPLWSRDAVVMPESATTAPTDRSMPPVRMTKVIPTASTMRNELLMNRLEMTRAERKFSYRLPPTTSMSASTANVPRTGR